ncbi:hypothetical protein Q8F55_005866 [Vanrija albida]|uniref:FUN14 domain-containing protein n=1 Tax=Vanrija albida TaxID=181172 RepID=A0ABR3Q3M2_9TREE
MSSLRTGLLPQLLRAAHAPARPAPAHASRFFSTPPNAASSLRSRFQQAQVVARAKPAPKPRASNAFLYAIGLGLAGVTFGQRTKLDAPAPAPAGIRQTYVNPNPPARVADDPPVESILSIGQLSFGAVCGISAGVFVKKGLKALAFVLGGIYVLLQYLSSKKFVSVDWKAINNSYDSKIGTTGPDGKVSYPSVKQVYNGFVDFLTANFQQRATFVAGFLLGLRVG